MQNSRVTAYIALLLLAGCIGKNTEIPENQETTENVQITEQAQNSTDRSSEVLVSVPQDPVYAQKIMVTGKRENFSHPIGIVDAMDRDFRHSSEPYYSDPSRENYRQFKQNGIKLVSEFPVSTFSIDVDTASYSNIRRFLNQGVLPDRNAVRVEELINYFSYNYPVPENETEAFSVTTELGPSPWHKERKLLHIGLKGNTVDANAIPDSNLVFLIDVSGSMRSPGKLELLVPALKMLTDKLRTQDRISIVVYAGASGTVLEPTSGSDTYEIYAALDQLEGGGSTNGGAGIKLAYSLARKAFIKDGINRIILATDGDFNVGITDENSLKTLIEQERVSGVSLTILGFGRGNYNDSLMQQLAQIGNGNAAYIDNINEARKVLVEELTSTLHTIANDVKIQIEFNPQTVSEYRLVGYETRHLEREDFNNDKIDAGDIGAGHTVTAIYEITLAGAKGAAIDPLRYGISTQSSKRSESNNSKELAFAKLRYKPGVNAKSILTSFPVRLEDMHAQIDSTSNNFRFSAAVAAFGQILKGGAYTDSFTLQDTLSLAQSARGNDEYGYRSEFINLVRTASVLNLPQVSRR